MSDVLNLRAGPLTLDFDIPNAFVRFVRLDQQEVLRGIFAAVRDCDWNTVPPYISELQVSQSDSAFELSFLADCRRGPIDFQWRGRITGSPQGTLRFEFAGQAHSAFWVNRIGLCVLHPSRLCAGQPCRIEHGDGLSEEGQFPNRIAPHQPFKNIRAVNHRVNSNLQARVQFEGEVFEMEDQRNWTDASFKTYCPPLERPFPVELVPGADVQQAVQLEMLGQPSSDYSRDKKAPAPIVIDVAWRAGRMPPPIGFGLANGDQQPTIAAVRRLAGLRPAHLRIELQSSEPQGYEQLDQAAVLAREIRCQLEVALDASQLRSLGPGLRKKLTEHRDLLARLLLLDPCYTASEDGGDETFNGELRKVVENVPVVVGTNAYFAELNRMRPHFSAATHVCYSMNPQVHAADKLSLCETLEAQPETVDSAFAIYGRPVVVSPITLRPRFNPNAATATTGVWEPASDPRQSTGFAAAWTVGVLQRLATHPHVASLTLFEAWGRRGVLGSDGDAYAMTSVFDHYQTATQLFPTTTSHPIQLTALGFASGDGRRRLLVGNLGPAPLSVSFAGDSASRVLAGESIAVWEV